MNSCFWGTNNLAVDILYLHKILVEVESNVYINNVHINNVH